MKSIQTERQHLFAPNAGVAICVSLGGGPSDEQLEAAIAEAVRHNESLHSKVVLQEDGSAFYQRAEPRYRVDSSDEEWTKIVERFPREPLDIFEGEMARFAIFRSHGALRLLVIGHHLAGDGLSFVFLIEDILRALGGQPLSYKPLQIVDERALPKRSGLPFLMKHYLRRFNAQWKKKKIAFSREDRRCLLERYAHDYDGLVLAHKLSEEETDGLIRRARAAQVSVNSWLATAFLRAQRRAASVGIAISIRDADDRGMANWVSGIKLDACYDEQSTFAENAKKVQTEIYRVLHDTRRRYFVLHFLAMMEGTLLDSAYMAKYSDFADPLSAKMAAWMGYTEEPRDLGITNLTRAAIPSAYGKYALKDMAFVPPVVPYGERILGVVTLGNTLSLTMNTTAADKDAEREWFRRAVGEVVGVEAR